MAYQIRVNSNRYIVDQLVELAGVKYTLQLRWNHRTGDWRMSLRRAEDDVYVLTAKRVSPGAVYPIEGGSLQVYGQDPYDRRDLGRRVQLWWWTTEELATATAIYPTDPAFALR